MEIAEPNTATKTRKGVVSIACAKMENFPMKPAVNGIPAIESIEIAAATANSGSVCANPLNAL